MLSSTFAVSSLTDRGTFPWAIDIEFINMTVQSQKGKKGDTLFFLDRVLQQEFCLINSFH